MWISGFYTCVHTCAPVPVHILAYTWTWLCILYAYYTHMSTHTHTHRSNDWGCSSVVEYLSSLGKNLYISQLASVWHSGRRGIIYIIWWPFVCVHKIIYKLQVGLLIVLVLCLLKKKIIKKQRDLGRAGASRTNKCVVERLEKRKAEWFGHYEERTGDERTVSSLHCHLKSWSYPSTCFHQGPCLGPWPYSSRGLGHVHIANVTAKGHSDFPGLSFCLGPCRCSRSS